jgi:hypothetical protein
MTKVEMAFIGIPKMALFITIITFLYLLTVQQDIGQNKFLWDRFISVGILCICG